MIAIEIPADLLAIRVVGHWLRGCLQYVGADDESLGSRIELALQEICVNIVEHAYGPEFQAMTIRLEYRMNGSTHTFKVVDHGCPFDQGSRPTVDINNPTEGGYGLFIAESIFDTMSYERAATSNTWTLTIEDPATEGP